MDKWPYKWYYFRHPTFMEYCHKEKKINEENAANIKVEVEWWQDAVIRVLDELHSIAGTPITWERLLDYCRARNLILGREAPFFVDELVLALIRELIFQYYGSTFFDGQDLSGSSFKSAELGTKILVVSQLGDEILKQVKIEGCRQTGQRCVPHAIFPGCGYVYK